MSKITATFQERIYNSYLDEKLQSFPYYDQETESIKYHPAAIYPAGVKQWRNNGELHSFNDEPSIIKLSRRGEITIQYYHKNGELHRDGDKPTYISKFGAQKYYKNGQVHRDGDKPAFINACGESYYVNGRLHRDGDKPAVVAKNGDIKYYKNGKLHRDNDKPAVIEAATIRHPSKMVYYKNGVKYVPSTLPGLEIFACHNTPPHSTFNSSLPVNNPIPINMVPVSEPIPLNNPFEDFNNKMKEIYPLKQTPPVMTVIKNPLEITHEDAIKFLLTCDDLEHHEKRDLIKEYLQKHNIVDIEQIIKFLLGCANITQSEKQEVLRLLIKKE